MKKKERNKKPWFKKPSQAVSMRMKRVKSTNTKIEEFMENLLKEQKIKYDRQLNLLGRPDFKIKGTNVLIFCDSSFWHGRREKERNGKAFKKNREFWANKLTENRKRDAKINRILKKEGWNVLRFWDTDILKYPEKVKNKLSKVINNEN